MTKIFNAAELREAYGDFFKASPGVQFDEHDVPAALAPLIPYARFWGLEESDDRFDLVKGAPLPLRRNLRDAVYLYDDAISEWLAGDDAQHPDDGSGAYFAFFYMLMASDYPLDEKGDDSTREDP